MTRDGLAVGRGAALDAFISYARRPSVVAFVDGLVGELGRRGKSVWVDRERVEAASQWRDRIEKGIEEARAFIFVLSESSARSAECLHELDVALRLHKRVVPIVFSDVPPDLVPTPLASINWIYYRDGDSSVDALAQVVDAMESDLEWRDAHSRLASRAKEWSSSNEDRSFLLRGTDLRQAESWYAARAGHREQPTPVHLEYIAASRKAASRRQRMLSGAVSAALAVAIVLALLALVQRDHAQQQARQAQSVAVAGESRDLLSTKPPLAVLLGLEARERAATPQAVDAVAAADAYPLVYAAETRAQVNAVVFSPDGKEMAVGTSDGHILLHDFLRGTTRTLDDGNDVLGLSFGYRGAVLASVDANGEVRARDLADGRRTVLNAKGAPVYALAFNPKSRTLAWGGKGGLVLYAPQGPKVVRRERVGRVESLAWSGDGQDLAIGVDDADGATGNEVLLHAPHRNSTFPEPSSPLTLAFSADRSQLAVGGSNGTVSVLNLDDGKATTVADGYAVLGLAFSPSGDRLALGDNIGQVSVRDLSQGTVATLSAGSPVSSVAFAAEGADLAVGDTNGDALVYDLSRAPFSDKSQVDSVAFGPAGALASATNDGRVVIHYLNRGRNYTLTDTEPVWSVAWAADGDELALSDQFGRVFRYDPSEAKQLPPFAVPGPAFSVAYSPDGRALAASSEKDRVVLYNLASGHKKHFNDPGAVYSIAFSPDGKELVSGDNNGGVWLHYLSGGRPKLLQRGVSNAERVEVVAFSPDGETVAAGDQRGRVVLFHLATGTSDVLNEGSPVDDVAFSADRRVLAVGDSNGDVRVYDLVDGDVTTVLVDGSPVGALAFNASGDLLATGDTDGTIFVRPASWDLSFPQLKRQLCAAVGDYQMSRSQWSAYVPGLPYQRTCP